MNTCVYVFFAITKNNPSVYTPRLFFDLLKVGVFGLQASLPNPPAPAKEAEASLEGYGKHVFWGEEAEKFLKAQGLMLADIKDPMWVHDANKADKIASAVMEWAKSHGAAYYCHWFQPMGSTMRHGQTGQVDI